MALTGEAKHKAQLSDAEILAHRAVVFFPKGLFSGGSSTLRHMP